MKRFSLIFLGALAMVIMAGCSKNDPAVQDEDAWVHDLSLPVPIRFGSGAPLTKGQEISSLEGQTICLWGYDEEQGLSHASCLFNAESFEVNGTQIETGEYYPMESIYNYSFYACSPVPEKAAYINDYGLCCYVALGDIDYIHAMAAVENGYNAKYVRAHGQPELAFKHVTASLSFKAMANSNGGKYTDEDFKKVSVNSVTIKDVPTSGDFVIAGEKAGTVVINNYRASKEVFKGSENPTIDGTLLGEQCFLYPDADKTFEIVVSTTYSDLGDVPYETTFVTPELMPGKKYEFQILFHQPEMIKIELKDPEWDDKETHFFDTDPDE